VFSHVLEMAADSRSVFSERQLFSFDFKRHHLYDNDIEIRPAGDQGEQSEQLDGKRARPNSPDFVQHTSPI
jgi:hypothetical protein